MRYQKSIKATKKTKIVSFRIVIVFKANLERKKDELWWHSWRWAILNRCGLRKIRVKRKMKAKVARKHTLCVMVAIV